MLLLLSPILQFLNINERIETSFYDYLQEEESRQLQQWEDYAQELEEKYNVKMYQEEGRTQ